MPGLMCSHSGVFARGKSAEEGVIGLSVSAKSSSSSSWLPGNIGNYKATTEQSVTCPFLQPSKRCLGVVSAWPSQTAPVGDVSLGCMPLPHGEQSQTHSLHRQPPQPLAPWAAFPESTSPHTAYRAQACKDPTQQPSAGLVLLLMLLWMPSILLAFFWLLLHIKKNLITMSSELTITHYLMVLPFWRERSNGKVQRGATQTFRSTDCIPHKKQQWVLGKGTGMSTAVRRLLPMRRGDEVSRCRTNSDNSSRSKFSS